MNHLHELSEKALDEFGMELTKELDKLLLDICKKHNICPRCVMQLLIEIHHSKSLQEDDDYSVHSIN